MKFTAKQIAAYLKGEIIGNENAEVTKISKIEEGVAGSLSFLANVKYEKYLYTTESTIVLVNNDFVPTKDVIATMIKVPNAYEAFAGLLDLYTQSKTKKSGIHKKAIIEKSAKLGNDIYVGPFVYVGENVVIGKNVSLHPHTFIGDNVTIGDNCVFNSGSKVYEECTIGNNCIIHSGVVIGSDGFGFAPQENNEYKKIPQVGNVILEDNVEIGSNSTIDRATMGSTIIKKGVKIDNLVQIAHNVVVDINTVIASQTGIAGSSKIGKNCMLGGQVGVAPHLQIADGTKIVPQSGIPNSVKKENTVLMGSPAFSILSYQKSAIYFKNLPSLEKRIRELENEIAQLKKQ